MKKQSTVRVYGVGGAGVNVVQSVNIPSDSAGFPETFFSLIDTSRSNLHKVGNKGDVFIIPGVDGSGKNRAFAHQVAKPHIDDILLKHPPKAFNLVVFGASGGSGSVLAPLLVEELLKRNQTVICFCIISTASAKEANNAYSTLSNLQTLTAKLNKAITVAFYTNCESTHMLMVDETINGDLRAISMLLSGTNNHLDTKDIDNWLNYERVTAVPVQLTDLVFSVSNTPVTTIEGLTAISVASLLTSKADPEISLGQLYSTVGYCDEAAQDSSKHAVPAMHFIITNQFLNDRVASLKKIVDDYARSKTNLLAVSQPVFDDVEDNDLFL